MRNEKNIGKHELIGLRTEVICASDNGQIGLSGEIVDESRDTLTIYNVAGRKVLSKKGLLLNVYLDDEKAIRLDCTKLAFRPEDRIKRVM